VILQTTSIILLLAVLSVPLSYLPDWKKDDHSRRRKNNCKKDDVTAVNSKKMEDQCLVQPELQKIDQ